MLEFLDQNVFTASNLGKAIGIFIIMVVIKFIYMGLTIMWQSVRDLILSIFKDEGTAAFCRKVGNLFFSNRFKWSDPVEDMNRAMVRTREAIRQEIPASDPIYDQITKDQERMWAWDERRKQIVWTVVFLIVCYYGLR
jgi:hypothetical protein